MITCKMAIQQPRVNKVKLKTMYPGTRIKAIEARAINRNEMISRDLLPYFSDRNPAGMDMTRLVTKKIGLDEVPKNLKLLQTDRNECKITAVL